MLTIGRDGVPLFGFTADGLKVAAQLEGERVPYGLTSLGRGPEATSWNVGTPLHAALVLQGRRAGPRSEAARRKKRNSPKDFDDADLFTRRTVYSGRVVREACTAGWTRMRLRACRTSAEFFRERTSGGLPVKSTQPRGSQFRAAALGHEKARRRQPMLSQVAVHGASVAPLSEGFPGAKRIQDECRANKPAESCEARRRALVQNEGEPLSDWDRRGGGPATLEKACSRTPRTRPHPRAPPGKEASPRANQKRGLGRREL